MIRKKIIFNNRSPSAGKAAVAGLKSGFIIGCITGLIEAQIYYFSMRGFDNSTWMLLITPLLYGFVAAFYGALLGLLYHFFGYILRPRKDHKGYAILSSLIITSIITTVAIIMVNRSLIFPRFHPVSLALDLVILALGYFTWILLSHVLTLASVIKKGIYAGFIIILLLFFAYTDVKNFKSIEIPAAAGRNTAGRQKPSIIMIVIDTLRADHVGCYGYPKDVTPVIDRLAAGGLLFKKAFSSTSWTIPSHFTLMTGVTSGAVREEFSISVERLTLAEMLQMNSYRTACISANPLLSPAVNFDKGFQFLDSEVDLINRINNLGLFQLLNHIKIPRPISGNKIKLFNEAEEVTDYALEWIDLFSDDPYFLFINYMDVHDPYLPPEKYKNLFASNYSGKYTGDICGELTEAEFIRNILPKMNTEDWKYVISQYDGAIRYVDDQIGRIVDGLSRKGKLDNTIIILLSDHGELFGEYDLAMHHLTLSEEETRIPLIIHYPAVIKTSAEVTSLARIVDLYPTISTMLNIEMDAAGSTFYEGVPLVKREGQVSAGPSYVALVLYENVYKASILGPAFKRNLFAFRNSEWKYIRPELNKDVKWETVDKAGLFRKEQIEERLYRISPDGSLEPVPPDDHYEIIKQFRLKLQEWKDLMKAKSKSLGDLEKSWRLKKDLEALGYIGPGYNQD